MSSKRVREVDFSDSFDEKFENPRERPAKRKRSRYREEVTEELRKKPRNHDRKTEMDSREARKKRRQKSKHGKIGEARVNSKEKNQKSKKKKNGRKDSGHRKSERGRPSKHSHHRGRINSSSRHTHQGKKNNTYDEDSVIEVSESGIREEQEKHKGAKSPESDQDNRLEEKQSVTEEVQTQAYNNSMELSLMSRRMRGCHKSTSFNCDMGERSRHHNPASYEKAKLKAESILEQKLSKVAGVIKSCTDRICKSSGSKTSDDRKQIIEKLQRMIEKENREGLALVNKNISRKQTFVKRCGILEKQLASSEERCKQLMKDARFCGKTKRKHKALESEFKIVCDHNTALQTELSEVKHKFQEQLLEKVSELDRLTEIRNSLTEKAKEFRQEIEKNQETQRVKYDGELNKIREDYSNEISTLQLQCSDLTISNLDLKKRNEELKNILLKNRIEAPALIKITAATPDKGPSIAQSEDAAKEEATEVKTPFSGHRQEVSNSQSAKSATEISLLKADIASLRTSLECKNIEMAELLKIYNIYVILTGLHIMRKDLSFECHAQNPEDRVEFLFSLVSTDNGRSLLYEKMSWDGDRECPDLFNNCSGQFFDREVAPLFLKNVIKEIFSRTKTNKPA